MTTRKKTQEESRIGVWMDHQIAHIVRKNEAGELEIETVESGFIPWKEVSGKQQHQHETRKHHREIESLKAYFKTLQKKLSAYNHILITGPSTARTEFHHQLQKARSFTGKRIAEEKANAMTERQLLSFMKKKLGKPMDIFREEEVV